MGANEKHDATYHGREYTPTTDEVRALYVAGTPAHRVSVHSGYAEFDRWLATVRAEAKAEALKEAAAEIDRLDSCVEMYDENLNARQVSHWPRERANKGQS